MMLDAEGLRSRQKSVTEVAPDVGYSSEAAFNRAFKRAFDLPLAQFRQDRREFGKKGNAAKHGGAD